MPKALLLLVVALTGTACSPPPAPSTPAPAPAPLTSGLDPAGFDRSVRPQDDLYAHVNGAWLKNTAIPPDKASYGGFYEADDRTQAQLRVLVEEAARNPGAAGSAPQKIGDFYTSFMDEARADSLGITPLAPELAAIDAIGTRQELAAYFARQVTLGIGGAPVQSGVEGDAQDPTRNVLYVAQGGLGLPDRDYYLKDDPKLKEYRAKYVAYIAAMLTAAGVPDAARAAAGVMALETRLARAHWTNVQNRDAVKTYNKVPLDALPTRFPGLDWAAWTAALGVTAAPHLVVAQPSYLAALARTVATTPVERWKPFLKFHAVDRFAPYLSSPLVNARFDFRGRTLQGIQELQPRWRRAIANLNTAAGELLGKLFVEAPLHARRQSPHGHAGREPAGRLRRRHRQPRVDEPGDEEGSARQAGCVPPQGRLSGEMARLLEGRDQQGRPCREHDARAGRRRGVPTRQGGHAGRSRGMGDDPAHRQRLLQPGAQRDRLPRRHPAAALLRYGRRRRDELRRHRRRHRPRDGPRLRRPGPSVRCQGRAARLVDEVRRRRVRAPGHGPGGALRRGRSAARSQGERRADARREHRRSRPAW